MLLEYPKNNKALRRKAKKIRDPQSTKVLLAIQSLKRAAREWESANVGKLCDGLAAPQIGIPLKLFIVRNITRPGDHDPWLVMYNPKFVESEGMRDSIETSPNVPGIEGVTLRPEKVTFHFYDHCNRRQPARGADDLNPSEYSATESSAAKICQLFDSLNGVLFIDSAYKTWKEGTRPVEPAVEDPAPLEEAA